MKTLACMASWLMYGLGDMFYKICDVMPDRRWLYWWHSMWYRAYNWCMLKSSDIQDATGCNGPWEAP